MPKQFESSFDFNLVDLRKEKKISGDDWYGHEASRGAAGRFHDIPILGVLRVSFSPRYLQGATSAGAPCPVLPNTLLILKLDEISLFMHSNV